MASRLIALLLIALASVTIAARADQAADAPAQPAVVSSPMNMDQPMDGGMKKDAMKKGDVKKSAEAKDRMLDKRLESEEKSMPPASPDK